MYIESVYAVSFGSLKNVSLDLTSGMNIVEGRNESGKSTFGELIRFIFYGFSGKADRENHLSFSTGIAEGSAIINCGGKRYRIERRCVGAKDSLSVIDLDDGSSCFAGKVPGEVFFRLPAKLFTSTVFVGQTAGRRIDGRETSEAVENLLFSADESVSAKKSLQILDKGRVSLLHKNGKGGRLYTVDGEIGELKEDFEAASRSNGEMISLRGSTAELSERLETEQRQSDTINKNLAGHRMLEIRARRKRLEDAERDYREIVAEADAFRKENTRNGFFPDREYARQLEECAGAIANAEARRKEADSLLKKLERERDAAVADRDSAEKKRNAEKSALGAKKATAIAAAGVCILFFIIAAAATVLMFLGKSELWILLAAVSLLSFAGMVTGFVFSGRISGRLKELAGVGSDPVGMFSAQLELIRPQFDRATEERDKYRGTLDTLCRKWGMQTTSTALNELREVLKRDEKLTEEVEKRRVAYVGLKTEDEELSRGEPEDDGSEITLPAGFDFKDAMRKAQFLSAKLKLDAEALKRNELRLAALEASVREPAEIAERLTALEYEREALEEQYRAYVLAFDSLNSASEKMRGEIAPRLTEMSGKLMGAVTHGKYDELGVDSGFSLSFRPETGNGGRITKGEEFMSAGTSDAAYVSLRLALAMLICGEDRLPPMFFDESFSRIDDTRLAAMLKILSASGAQTVIFTSLDREKEIADREGIDCGYVRLG